MGTALDHLSDSGDFRRSPDKATQTLVSIEKPRKHEGEHVCAVPGWQNSPPTRSPSFLTRRAQRGLPSLHCGRGPSRWQQGAAFLLLVMVSFKTLLSAKSSFKENSQVRAVPVGGGKAKRRRVVSEWQRAGATVPLPSLLLLQVPWAALPA